MAPQNLLLMYGTAEDHKGVLLVASYCGLQDQLDAQASESLCLKIADGQELQSFNSICRYLASCSPKSKQLLGDTHSDRALVRQWLFSHSGQNTPELCFAFLSLSRFKIGCRFETLSYQACWNLRC